MKSSPAGPSQSPPTANCKAAVQDYWTERLRGAASRIDLPVDRPQPPESDGEYKSIQTRLNAPVARKLETLAVHLRGGRGSVLLAAWSIMIARMAGASELIVGCTWSNGAECFSPMPLQISIADTPSGVAVARQIDRRLSEAQAHAEVPVDLWATFAPFQLGFSWQASDAICVSARGPANLRPPDLALVVTGTGDGVDARIEYSSALFDVSTVERLQDRWLHLLEAMAGDPELAVDRLPIVSPAEQGQVLHDWNLVGSAFPAKRCLHELFEDQVAKSPQATALVFGEARLTYAELNARANRLAHHLIKLGVKPDSLVAIALPRSLEMVVALLATLKAGGAYVPLDPAYPPERLAFTLEDSSPQALITNPHTRSLLGELAGKLTIVDIDSASPPWEGLSDGNPEPGKMGLRSDHLAYVIYTSGSTGKPKGVMIEHANVVRLFAATDAWFKFDANDVWTLFHSYAFDFSVWELWGALLYGGRLVVVPYATARSPTDFYRLLCDEAVTVLNQTPSAFRQLIAAQAATDRTHRLRYVIFGGEALEVATLEPWFARNDAARTQLINMYGITETTVHVTYRHIQPADTKRRGGSPIGSRIPDLRIYILDDHRQPVPIGTTGELYVGGAGVARGYLNRAELTAERFLADPFADEPGQRIYKTGDLGRWLPDGSIEFSGRNDFQVKIRGFRIEIGEIENVLARHRAVRNCAVLARTDPGSDTRLVAYVVADQVGVAELREYLGANLPEFMIPAAFVFLPTLPLTVNGKLDRAALPAPEQRRPDLAQPYLAPLDETEQMVCDLFAQQLAVDRVGRLDNFFELGGNSLAVLRLIVRLKERSGRDFPAALFFNQPTPAAIAAALGGSAHGAIPDNRLARHRRHADRDDGAIAIIAMTGRFPGAGDVEELWRNLREGVDAITYFADDQLDPSIPAELRNDPTYIKARGTIADIEMFDAAFFGISPREAEVIDPQQRIFLELCWQCLERAGYAPDATTVPVGVFGGMFVGSYFQNHVQRHPEALRRIGDLAVMLGNEKDYIASRVANRLNLTGPAVSVHTACSTSLVAVVQAVSSLRAGQCDMALAGGVAVTCPPQSGYLYQEGAVLSPDGHTRTFDADAQGTVFSDGAGVVLLKRLADALADADPVIAVIRGVAINNDGGEKASFTAPSLDGQAAVIAAALDDAGVDARQISYVEAHGTATPLGDPIEVEALAKAYRKYTEATGFCRLGSIKSNLGHLVTAAGAAGLIKTALALQHEELPASLHYQAPNPKIDFAATPFVVNRQISSWLRCETPRLAGVSSFGFGGTNAHVIVEEAPVRAPSDSGVGPHLLLLSARTPNALSANLARLADHLESVPDTNLADVAYTLRIGRKYMTERACVVADSVADAVARLRADGAAGKAVGRPGDRAPDVIFMFPGQAAQYVAMGSALYAAEPAFAETFDTCVAALEGVADFDLKERLFKGDAAALTATATTQPALFCIEYALAHYWMTLGLQPKAMLGHSVGEFVAAALAGVFSLEDAVRLVALRGRLMQALPAGAMLAVRLPAAQVAARLPADLSIAAENSPAMCVASGPFEAIDAFRRTLEAEGVSVRQLQTSHAFHSAMMDPAVEPFAAEIRKITLKPPQVAIYSTVTGRLLTDQEACDPEYWARHLRLTVRFSTALLAATEAVPGVLLEVGPRATLGTLARQHTQGCRPPLKAIQSLADAPDTELENLRLAAGRLWLDGAQLQLEALDARARKQRIVLPAYAFERSRHWLDAPAAVGTPEPCAPQAAITVSAIPTPVLTSSEAVMTQANAQSRIPELTAKLRDMLEDTSGVDLSAAPTAATFVEIGLDSLTLTQVAIQLKQAFKVNITFRQLMEQYPSLEALAAYLDQQLPAQPRSAAPAVVAAAAPVAAAPALMAAPVAMFAPSTASAAGAPASLVQQVIQQQVQIMAQQLALLQGVPLAAAPQPAAAEVAPVVPAIHPATTPMPNAMAPAPSAGDEDTDGKGPIKYDVKKAFGAIARIHTDAGSALSERQRARLDAFMRRYIERTRRSKEYTQANRAHLADPRVVNGFRPAIKEIVYQIVVDRSKGSKLWDLDGNEYVDAINGFGMSLFGWQPPFVVDAVKKQIDLGYEIGPLHPMAGEVAKLICDMTGHDRAGLCNTGSEAVMGAMRIARTITGRNLIVMFTGSYHGIFDEVIVRATKRLRPVPAAPGILANTTENVIVLDYGTPEALEIIKSRADEIAAVLIEPVQSRRPDFRPIEFLREVREITRKSGAVFILDEVVTGFRSAPGGIQQLFDIRADICTYGKVIGGGYPIGAIAGKREFIDALDGGWWQYGDDSAPTIGVTYFAGTFVRHPLALAAAKASLLHMQQQGPDLQKNLTLLTDGMAEEMNTFCRKVGAPIEVRHFASLWKIFFTEDHPLQDLLFAMMRNRGIHLIDNFPCFMTTAHSKEDAARIAAAFKEAVTEMQESEFLPRRVDAGAKSFDASRPPVPGARLGKDSAGNPAWFVADAKNPGKYLKVEA